MNKFLLFMLLAVVVATAVATASDPAQAPTAGEAQLDPETQKMGEDALKEGQSLEKMQSEGVKEVKETPEPTSPPEPTDPPPPTNLKEQLAGQLKEMGDALKKAIEEEIKAMKDDPAKYLIKQAKEFVMTLMPLLPPAWRVKKIPENLEELKKLLVTYGRLVMIDCANGQGLLKSLAPACKVLVKGIKLGRGYLGLLDIYKDSTVPYVRIVGKADLSCIFGDSGSDFSFQLEFKKPDGIGFACQVPSPGVKLSLGDAIANLGELFKVPGIREFVYGIGLGKIAASVESIGFNIKPFGFRFRGNLHFFGDMDLSIVVAPTSGSKMAFALDLGFTKGRLDNFLAQVLGPAYPALRVVAIKTLKFSMVSTDFDLTPYPALTDNGGSNSYTQGLSFELMIYFDKNGPNPVGAFLGQFLQGEFGFIVRLTPEDVSATLRLPNLVITPNIIFMDNELQVACKLTGAGLTIGINAALEINLGKEKVKFSANVAVNMVTQQLLVQLSMKGFIPLWPIPKLAIGNLVGRIGATYVPPYLTALGLGGSVRIGLPGDEANPPIIGGVYVMINILSPDEIFLQGIIKDLTLKGIFYHILDIKNPPKWVLESNAGLSLDVAIATKKTKTISGSTVEQGVRLKGEISLLALKVTADIEITLTNFKFDVNMAPLRLANGVLAIYRSRENVEEGPIVQLNGALVPFKINFNIEGFASAYFFQAGVKLVLADDEMEFRVYTPVFFIFLVDLRVRAKYGPDLASMAFEFHALISTVEIRKQVFDGMQRFEDDIKKALDSAQNMLDNHRKGTEERWRNCMRACSGDCGPGFVELAHVLGVISDERFESLIENRESAGGMFLTFEEIRQTDTRLHIARTASMSEADMVKVGYMHDAHQVDISEFLEQEQELYNKHTRAGDEDFDEDIINSSLLEQAEVLEGHRTRAESEGRFFEERELHEESEYVSHAERLETALRNSRFASLLEDNSEFSVWHDGNVDAEADSQANALVEGKSRNTWGFFNWREAACNVKRTACHVHCNAKKMLDKLAEVGLSVAAAAGNLLKIAASAIFNVVRNILKQLDVHLKFAGAISTETFNFLLQFLLRFGDFKIDFELRVDFSKSQLRDFTGTIIKLIKNILRQRIPGAAQLLGAEEKVDLAGTSPIAIGKTKIAPSVTPAPTEPVTTEPPTEAPTSAPTAAPTEAPASE